MCVQSILCKPFIECSPCPPSHTGLNPSLTQIFHMHATRLPLRLKPDGPPGALNKTSHKCLVDGPTQVCTRHIPAQKPHHPRAQGTTSPFCSGYPPCLLFASRAQTMGSLSATFEITRQSPVASKLLFRRSRVASATRRSAVFKRRA